MTTFPSNLSAATTIARLRNGQRVDYTNENQAAVVKTTPAVSVDRSPNRNPLRSVSDKHTARARELWRNARPPELHAHLRREVPR
jgi:hypothetical protein